MAGRYNEDTDICLRLLKDNYVQFSSMLSTGKLLLKLSRLNTAEFYHAENEDNEEFQKTIYNADGQ